jgi:hypothetical protein
MFYFYSLVFGDYGLFRDVIGLVLIVLQINETGVCTKIRFQLELVV